MKKNILQILKIIILAIILSVGVSFIYAQSWPWQDPTDPPSNNVLAPLNTTTNAQIKFGGLLLDQDSFFLDIGFMVFSDPGNFGKVGIGTMVPEGKVSVAGGSDAGLGGGGYIVIGSLTGTNIVIDDDEIMARDNYGTSPLYIQKEGGDTVTMARLLIGQGSDSGNDLHVNGAIGATGMVGAGCEGDCNTSAGIGSEYAILHPNGSIQSSKLKHNLELQNVCANNNGDLILC